MTTIPIKSCILDNRLAHLIQGQLPCSESQMQYALLPTLLVLFDGVHGRFRPRFFLLLHLLSLRVPRFGCFTLVEVPTDAI